MFDYDLIKFFFSIEVILVVDLAFRIKIIELIRLGQVESVRVVNLR